ncbi:hypothetical protein QWM81_04170 [Streptomyces ficellus]|uniref:Uncharacterized protein n=1 Tax=Streptomyces ficellus TaxID=1977088 RepID=A0ABT7Z187_9ACTN|nr:hypothetical protein [Streptomyces ficellus]MDN3293258.1 hypothetical protein [Streptomyces ficellus]
MDELRKHLREAAHAHRPDRARILARVERGMARPPADGAPAPRRPSPRTPWLRVAGATAAAAVLAVGGYTVASVLQDEGPAATVATPPHPVRVRAEGVIDPHSNRFWAQSNLTVTTSEPLTALTVDLRVVQTGGIADTGHWRTRPAGDFTVSVREDKGALRYTWTLRPGRTVPAGRHVFAAQYNHAEGGRDATGDRYAITSTAAGGQKATVRGDFAP